MKSEVCEYTTPYGKKRYLIATYKDGRYVAAMDEESKRLTGAYAVFSKTIEGLVVNTQTYAHRSSALRALKQQEG